jgi:hypothetical protein
MGGGNGLTNQNPPLALPSPSHIPLTWHSGTEVVTSGLQTKVTLPPTWPPSPVSHRHGPWFHKVPDPFTLCLAKPGRHPTTVVACYDLSSVYVSAGAPETWGSHVEDQDEEASLFTLSIVHLFHHVSFSRLYV